MSQRSQITNALVEKLKEQINGSRLANISGNAYAKLKFWDEVHDFPCIYVVPGAETRDYLPGEFKWAYLNISLKVYVKDSENPEVELEKLLDDIEYVVDGSRELAYDESDPTNITTEILISSIVTDEGLLAPYGVGEVNLQVRYQKL
jgi:hypothetical protein